MLPTLRILVVDDESGIVLLCQQLLELSSFAVVTATEPQQAIALANERPFDLLLTDIRMPEMDGFELVSQIKAIQPEIAVVIMTGYNTVETAIKALRSGVDGLVIKPYELGSELLEIIQQAVQSNQRKHGSVALRALQPMFDLGSLSLAETTPAAVEKQAVDGIAEILRAAHAGVYVRPQGRTGWKALQLRGSLPPQEDAFWAHPRLCDPQENAEVQLWRLGKFDAGEEAELLRRLEYACCAAVCVRRRKEDYLFLAARALGEPGFEQTDLDVFVRTARQFCASMENTRWIANVSAVARRVERSSGLMEASERMRQIEWILPSMLPDLNNPLQSVKNNLYLAGRPDNRGSRASDYLSMAQKELYRLEVALQRLIALNQPICADRANVEVESLIQQTIDLLAARLKEAGITVKTNYTRPLLPVQAVRDQIEQVLLILFVNALEAMQGAQGEKLLWIDAACAQNVLRISIEDSGPGISDAVRAQLFRPFFTTKPEGSGVGLVVAKRILEAHHGTLVNAPPRHGSGANMEMRLPC
jgi:CheY-like chemotaxis protein